MNFENTKFKRHKVYRIGINKPEYQIGDDCWNYLWYQVADQIVGQVWYEVWARVRDRVHKETK